MTAAGFDPEGSQEPISGRVFVMADEPGTAIVLRAQLGPLTRHEVHGFESGEEALTAIARGLRPDLVLADLSLSNTGGDALRRVREGDAHVSLVVLASRADRFLSTRFLRELELFGVLFKPWDPNQLELVVRNAIEQCWLRRRLERVTARVAETHCHLHAIREQVIAAFS